MPEIAGRSDVPFATRHAVVTPSDSDNLPFMARTIKALASGDIALVDTMGTVIVYTVAAGDELPVGCIRVNATGTTCASIVAWF